MTRLISSVKAAIENIHAYEKKFVTDNPKLIGRLAMHRAWYAVRDSTDNAWRFGNSKIIGYANLTPDKYVSGGLDGRKTEAILREWFIEVEPGDPNYVELWESLASFLDVYEKSPSKLARVNVLKNEVTPIDEDPTDKRLRGIVEVLLRPGQAEFRRKVFKRWKARCLITRCTTKTSLEAAHIVPVAENGVDDEWNGLPLRADIHRLFDANLIWIDAESRVHVADEVAKDYKKYRGDDLSKVLGVKKAKKTREALSKRSDLRNARKGRTP